MCGIAGVRVVAGADPVSFEVVRNMVAVLGHRGPDGHGLYRDDHVALGHARLGIIDLEGGFQPLTNEDQSVWLTFNGEIFNYVELRRELRAKGHRFGTDGDSEVIVHLYEEYGTDAWRRLNGQFAFALWDRPRRQLWLVRDRVGILPLQYARVGPQLLFGSEAKALFASGMLQPELDPGGIVESFTRWSVSAPNTIFRGVRSVRPGTAVCIDAELNEHEIRYWQLTFAGEDGFPDVTVDAAADQLDEQLAHSVALRLRADVPVGGYLSGGLDSSVIAQVVKGVDSSPLETFAVRFEDPAFDETSEQRRMATLLGTRHHELLCGPGELRAALADVVWHCESPLLRTAPVPMFLLSGLVRDSGMKVVLTGEGADEFLGGYGIFKEDKIRRFWARQPDSKLRPQLLGRVHGEVGTAQSDAAKEGGLGSRDTELWQRFFARGMTDLHEPMYSHLIRWENTAWALRVLAPSVRESTSPEALSASLASQLPAEWTSWTPMARAQWLEVQTFMTPYLLSCQGDRVAMAHGVEVRYPFLDPELVEWCTQLPTHLKMPALRDKLILRRVASRSLPREIWQRPKQPYRAPMTAPFFGPDADSDVGQLLSREACVDFGLVDPLVAERLVTKARRFDGHMSGEREEMALIGMLTLQMLARAYRDDWPTRARSLRAALDQTSPHVFVDVSGSHV